MTNSRWRWEKCASQGISGEYAHFAVDSSRADWNRTAEPARETKMKAFAITIMIIMAAIIVIVLAGSWHSDNVRNQKIEATTSPQEFISLEIYEPKANVEVRHIQDSLLVTYDLDPWMMTRKLGEIELYGRA